MEETVQQITDCFNEIDLNPSKENYLKLISILTSNKDLMKDELIEAWSSMEKHYHLTEDEWDSWLEIEMAELKSIKNHFELRLKDNPSSSLVWLKFLDLLTLDDPEYKTILDKALRSTTYDLLDNHLVIQRAITYYEKSDPNDIKQLVLSVLQIPHTSIEDTLSYYSSYVSVSRPDHYEEEMIEARKTAAASLRFLDFIEMKEIERISKSQNPQFWIDYMNTKGSKEFKSVPVLLGIFERAVRDQEHEHFIIVWETMLDLLYELNASVTETENILERFVKRYPHNCHSWSLYIRNLHSDDRNKFIYIRENVLIKVLLPQNTIPYADKKSLLMSVIAFMFKLRCFDEYKNDIDMYFNYSLKQRDALATVEKLVIQSYEELDNAPQAKILTKDLTADEFHGSHVDIWLFRLSYELKYGDSKSIFKFFKESILLAQKIDYPDVLFDAIQRYSYLNYDAVIDAGIRKLIQKTRDAIAQQKFSTKRSHSDDEPEQETPDNITNEASKRSRTTDLKTRDREHLTLLVKNLPKDVKGSDIKLFFKGCDPINNINIISSENSSTNASVEFGTTQAMLSLLTKNYKKIAGHEILIEQAFNTTLWVTNFPPSADKSWLENQFKKYGTIASIRLPSLKTNASRRFCYVEFTSSADAAEAVSLLDGKEIEGYELVVKISNPDAKQQRSGAIEEGREVYICKIDFNRTTSEKVRQVFEKFGTVDKVYLPLSNKNKTTGRLHDGYGFVTFAKLEDATRSLELNGVNLDGRIIEVTIAQPRAKTRTIIKSNHEGSNAIDTIKSKTLRVTNLPDTVSANRLKSFLEQVGPVLKVDLNTETNSAIIEFEKVSDAGVASMKLSGVEIDGCPIEINSRWGHEKLKQSVVDAPMPNRRQRRLLLQQLKVEEKGENDIKDVEMGENKGGLSNTDFRAMLLGKK